MPPLSLYQIRYSSQQPQTQNGKGHRRTQEDQFGNIQITLTGRFTLFFGYLFFFKHNIMRNSCRLLNNTSTLGSLLMNTSKCNAQLDTESAHGHFLLSLAQTTGLLETADSAHPLAAASSASIGTEGGGGAAGTSGTTSVFNITELARLCYWFR